MDNLTPRQILSQVKNAADVNDIKVVSNGRESYVLIYTSSKAKKPAYKFPLAWMDALYDQFGDDFNHDVQFDVFGEPPVEISK